MALITAQHAAQSNSAADLPPAIRLLLACSRFRFCAEAGAGIRDAARELRDWGALEQLAADHALRPVLLAGLVSVAGDLAPCDSLDRLKEFASYNARRNFFLTTHLAGIVSAFEARRAGCICLKGPVLAWQAHGDVGLREFSDLDLLVKPRDVALVREVLVERGFVPQFNLSLREERQLLSLRNEHGFWNPRIRLGVDVHWSLFPRYFVSREWDESVWDRSEEIVIAGRCVRVLSAEDTVIFLSVHGTKHSWERLGWIADLAQFLEVSRMDPARLMDLAKSARCTRMVALGLSLAHDLCGGGEIRFGIAPRELARVRRLGAEIVNRLATLRPIAMGSGPSHRFCLRSIEGAGHKLIYVFDTAIRPKPLEWSAVRLPPLLRFLYYPLRPLRLAWKHFMARVRRASSTAVSERTGEVLIPGERGASAL